MSQELLELIYVYINNVLADETYDPHLSTIEHYKTLLEICGEGLPLGKGQEEAIVISCCGDVIEPDGPGACAIVVRFPNEKKPAQFSRILPKARDRETTAYDAIYEALLFIGNHPERFRKHDYPIHIQLANRIVVEQTCPGCIDPGENFRNKWESVTQGLKDYREIFQREIRVVWRPDRFTQDLKQALEMVKEELATI